MLPRQSDERKCKAGAVVTIIGATSARILHSHVQDAAATVSA
jgi:hypothetical protein